MAWIFRYILWISVFQITTRAAQIAVGVTVRGGESFTNRKSNGSYKILNRLVRPFINKRVADAIVFPEDQNLVIPEKCMEIGICDRIPNYPQELVAMAIKELEKQNTTRFNIDKFDIPEIAQRIGSEEETIELCNSSEQPYAPESARDENDVWHVILNDRVKPKQQFRVEICHSQDTSCSPLAYFHNANKSKCVQKYTYRNMYALNNNSKVIEKPFKVPSCCKCVVIMN